MKLDIFNYISFYNLLYKNENRKYHANNLFAKMRRRNRNIIKKVARYSDNYETWIEKFLPKEKYEEEDEEY